MKKKLGRHIAAICSAAVLTVGAACMFAGCTSNHPEVTITYTFNGKDYKVEYTLSRLDAPQTVKHFIELADAGYYNGTIIHDYNGSSTDGALYGGGYKLNEEGNDIEPIDYFTELPRLEKEKKMKFTQSVWMNNSGRAPLYTLYGEFEGNGVHSETDEYRHSYGALVMYYSKKPVSAEELLNVTVVRADKGKDNDGEKYQSSPYAMNSATSLFYTYLGGSSSKLDKDYAVFGMVKDKTSLDALIDAIDDFKGELDDEESFTKTTKEALDAYDHLSDYFSAEVQKFFGTVRTGGGDAEYNTPVETPITIKSVKVNKY